MSSSFKFTRRLETNVTIRCRRPRPWEVIGRWPRKRPDNAAPFPEEMIASPFRPMAAALFRHSFTLGSPPFARHRRRPCRQHPRWNDRIAHISASSPPAPGSAASFGRSGSRSPRPARDNKSLAWCTSKHRISSKERFRSSICPTSRRKLTATRCWFALLEGSSESWVWGESSI